MAAAAVVLLTSPVRKEPGPEAVAETIPADEEALSADGLAAYLSAGRTPYIGSPFQDQALFGRLPVPEKLVYEKMELQTSEEPYELRMIYRVKDGSQRPEDTGWIFSNAVLLFATIENAGKISYAIEEGNNTYYYQYERSSLEVSAPCVGIPQTGIKQDSFWRSWKPMLQRSILMVYIPLLSVKS